MLATDIKFPVIKIKEIDAKGLSENVIYECNFCKKLIKIRDENKKIYDILSGEYFHCPFCLRNNFHTKNNKHVLMLSFKGIFAYYYYSYYLYTTQYNHKMSYSEINEYIDMHTKVGLLNPVFNYDPDTYLWFIDFSKVGNGKKKISLDSVLKTISNILVCFNMKSHLDGVNEPDVFIKYKESIELWCNSRIRPEKKHALIPTLIGSGIWHSSTEFTLEQTREFMPNNFVLR